jgi:hypothetical protein
MRSAGARKKYREQKMRLHWEFFRVAATAAAERDQLGI